MKPLKARSKEPIGTTPGDNGELTVEALTIRYAVLKSFEMLDELSATERTQVSLMLASDLARIARTSGVATQEEIAERLTQAGRSGDRPERI